MLSPSSRATATSKDGRRVERTRSFHTVDLTLDEAIEAATTGGAKALRRHNVGEGQDPQGRPAKGTLVPGAAADLHILDAENAINLAYRPGMPITWQTWVAGERVYG